MPTNTQRIAKNTLMLYFRQILIMLVSLYTVRVVLNTLGAEDYGIYNVVAGVVAMFGFLSGSMATASQRYFSFEIGRGDFEQLRRVFSVSLTIYMMIAVLVLILAETAGLWFALNRLVIPLERKGAALWVYQLSIISFLFTILTSPYMAAIIAHEDMNIYAYVSIVEAALKLAVVFLLGLPAWDKLQLYGILLCAVTAINTTVYRTICSTKYPECKFRLFWNKKLFKEISMFTGWSFIGSIAWLIRNQGSNIILNIFFGPLVNAARSIASQVNAAITAFCDSFTKAMYPSIIKSYTNKDKEHIGDIVITSSKFSYFLFLILSMPLLLETEFILTLWLKNVPEYAVLFVRLVLLDALITAFTYSIGALNQATGNIKLYQGIIGGFLVLNLPVSILLFYAGFGPEWTLYIAVVFSFLALIFRLLILKWQTGFPAERYIKDVLIRAVITTCAAFIFPVILRSMFHESFSRFIFISLVSIFCCAITIFLIGLKRNERNRIKIILQNKLNRILQ
jgi:O-antigen/teichoic acid export membrane protein